MREIEPLINLSPSVSTYRDSRVKSKSHVQETAQRHLSRRVWSQGTSGPESGEWECSLGGLESPQRHGLQQEQSHRPPGQKAGVDKRQGDL